MKVNIIGAGLSGLTLAWLLQRNKFDVTIFEASSRIGGRIQTVSGELGTPLELGATWFSEVHPQLFKLITALGIKPFAQFAEGISLFHSKSFEPPQQFFTPAPDVPSYRVENGTSEIIKILHGQLPVDCVKTETRIIQIEEKGNTLVITDGNGQEFESDFVVSCVPPKLLNNQVKFLPSLPAGTHRVMSEVQTWMAGAAKFVVEYAEPFWRNKGFSGSVYSHVGLIAEMYDHNSADGSKFGFTGFLNASASYYNQEERKKIVTDHLTGFFGEAAKHPITYFDKIWADEFITDNEPSYEYAHQNNGHPALQESYMSGKFLLSGTETARSFPGYMEGAVVSAYATAEKIGSQSQPLQVSAI